MLLSLREEAIDQGDGMNTTDFQTRTTATPTQVGSSGFPASRRTAFFGAGLRGTQRPPMQRLAMSDCHRASALRRPRTGDMSPPTDRANEFPRRLAPQARSATGGS
ncbi:MAG: hypothetical protein ABS35_28645 [Kaistia sp. SCN 65-12]|nr:MAG: hypothetical protein ABS35_28645 [Kaistia sp. SCN 65-12]